MGRKQDARVEESNVESKPRMDANSSRGEPEREADKEGGGSVPSIEQQDAAASVAEAAIELRYLEPELLVPLPDDENPRGAVNTKSESFRDLVKSIAADGVREPGQARPHKTIAGKYELLSGHRRRLACIEAGRLMPVDIHPQMSDEEAWKIVVATNFAREDLTPLQQGRAVEVLLRKTRGDVASVAATMGQSAQWVALRARLGKLSPKWKKAIDKGEFGGYGVGHLELIARLPAAVQESMLVKSQWGGPGRLCPREHFSVRELEKFLDSQFVRALAKAPWAIDDCELGPRGTPCSECAKRSSREALLFGADGVEGTKGGADRCLDAACYRARELGWMRRRYAEVERERGEKLEATVTENGGYRGNDWDAVKAAFGTPAHVDWNEKVHATEVKGGKPCFAVDGPHAGKVVWVVKAKREKTDSMGRDTSSKGYLAQKKMEQLAERRRYAEDFAAAAGAMELAKALQPDGAAFGGPDIVDVVDVVEVARLCDLCVAYRMAEGGMTNGAAWDWLRVQLGVVVAKKGSYGTFEEELRPHELPQAEPGWGIARARAMAVFLCERDQAKDEPVFAEEKRAKNMNRQDAKDAKKNGKKVALPANPARRAEVMSAAAGKFVIDEYFLSKHSSASVQVIARELGVKCKSTRGGTVEAILGAGLPAGTMTVELARAFGVKYVEPKGEKRSKGAKVEGSKGREKRPTTKGTKDTKKKGKGEKKKLNRQDAKNAKGKKMSKSGSKSKSTSKSKSKSERESEGESEREEGVCRVCGCTEEEPCAEGCGWADETMTICTRCAEEAEAELEDEEDE